MTLTIDLSPEQEAIVRQLAHRERLAPEDFVQRLVSECCHLTSTADSENAADRALLTAGLLRRVPEIGEAAPLAAWVPLTVQGAPVSETIRQDRR